MAPEQYKFIKTVKTDIWALGATLFFLFFEMEPYFWLKTD